MLAIGDICDKSSSVALECNYYCDRLDKEKRGNKISRRLISTNLITIKVRNLRMIESRAIPTACSTFPYEPQSGSSLQAWGSRCRDWVSKNGGLDLCTV